VAVRSRSRVKRAVTFHIPLGLLVGATLFPFYWMVITSVRPDVELYNVKMNPFFTLHPTLTHFYYLFELTMFPRWAWNTLFIATVSTGISLFCGLLAGYALARLQFRWAPPLGTMIFITYLVPPTLLFIPLGDVVKTFGLGDTPWAVILTYPTFLIPFCTWLLMGYFKTIPREIEECARIDGASRIQAMVRISFPLAVPGILSAGIFAFTLSWNEFLYALVFLSSPDRKSTRLNSSHGYISYAVFCLKKKNNTYIVTHDMNLLTSLLRLISSPATTRPRIAFAITHVFAMLLVCCTPSPPDTLTTQPGT